MKTALVLSGGGARGAYQIGVMKALQELNIKCDIALGSSIGSINAAFYTTGELEKAISLWKKIDINSVFAEEMKYSNNRQLMIKYLKRARKGGLEPIRLKEELQKSLNIDLLYESDINYGLTVVKYPRLVLKEYTKNEINKNKIIDYIIASCTVFPVFKLQEIDNDNYMDGGFKEAVPYEFAQKLGADKFIVVNISVFKRNFELSDSENLIFIKPNNKLGNPLVFDNKKAIRNIKYGYNDTMKKFNKFDGNKYTFKALESSFLGDEVFKTFPQYLKVMEYLANILELDDSKIYSQRTFNKNVKKVLFDKDRSSSISLRKHKRKIILYYNYFKKGKNRAIKYRNYDFLAAYYLYNFCK